MFAKSLTNLSYEQGSEACSKTADRLENIAKIQDIPEIWALFALSLSNQSYEQDGEECSKTVDRIETIARDQNTPVTWIILSQALLNLSSKQELDECSKTVDRLEELARTNDILKIWYLFARGLSTLASVQTEKIYNKAIKQIAKMQDDQDMVMVAESLISLVEEEEAKIQITHKLDELVETGKYHEIVAFFMENMYSQADQHDVREFLHTIKRLEEVAKRENDPDIWDIFEETEHLRGTFEKTPL